MVHASLFSGIGGFDYAAQLMGWKNLFHCEKEPFCQAILNQHFPNSILHNDIKTTDFTIYRNRVGVLSGGFPCQPFSLAGKRKGREDERHLWPEMLRAVGEIQSPWVVGENVFGIVNWDKGLVFEQVQAEMEAKGYEVQPFILPACAVNAPHRRDRVWFIAYSADNYRRCAQSNQYEEGQFVFSESERLSEQRFITDTTGIRFHRNDGKRKKGKQFRAGRQAFDELNGNGGEKLTSDSKNENAGLPIGTKKENTQFGISDKHADVADNISIGCDKMELQHGQTIGEMYRIISENGKTPNWENWPTQPGVCRGNDGVPNRVDRIKSLGNAIVPQVALQIFKAIEQYEILLKTP